MMCAPLCFTFVVSFVFLPSFILCARQYCLVLLFINLSALNVTYAASECWAPFLKNSVCVASCGCSHTALLGFSPFSLFFFV